MDKVKINNPDFVKSPAKVGDSGFDIIASSNPIIIGLKADSIDAYYSIDYIEYETNLVIEPPHGYHTYVFPRSSISSTNLILCNSVGLIDNGYRGTIKLRFKYVAQPIDLVMIHGIKPAISPNKNKLYRSGEKIGQLVFAQSYTPELVCGIEDFNTDRKEGGFGSTGL